MRCKALLASYGFIMTVLAAGLTSFYSWRLIFMTFHGTPHDQHHYEAAHESPKVMLIPLAILAFGAIFAGYPFVSPFHRRRGGRLLPRFAGAEVGRHDLLEEWRRCRSPSIWRRR